MVDDRGRTASTDGLAAFLDGVAFPDRVLSGADLDT